MQPSDELVSIILRHRHESTSHQTIWVSLTTASIRGKSSSHDLDFVYVVAQASKLIDTSSSLLERVVSRSDGSHRCGLIVSWILIGTRGEASSPRSQYKIESSTQSQNRVLLGNTYMVNFNVMTDSLHQIDIILSKEGKVTYTQMFPVMATCGHRCGLHMTATTATPLAVLTGFALNQPLNLSFHSSGTAERTSVNLGIADRLYFLAYFIRRLFTFGGEAWDVEEWVEMRSRTMADTHSRCSSACD